MPLLEILGLKKKTKNKIENNKKNDNLTKRKVKRLIFDKTD